jgi:hypothetical protein
LPNRDIFKAPGNAPARSRANTKLSGRTYVPLHVFIWFLARLPKTQHLSERRSTRTFGALVKPCLPSPEEGALIVGLLEAHGKAIETGELVARLAALEERLASPRGVGRPRQKIRQKLAGFGHK